MRNAFSVIACSICFLLISPNVQSQVQGIDQYVQAEMKYERVPGIAVGMSDGAKPLKLSGYGDADSRLKVPAGPQTVFNSGSMAKQFVAAAIMLLVQDGKLNLDDSVAQYLQDAPANWKTVKIEHLLSHTSGLGDYSTTELTAPGAPFDFTQNISEEELRRRLYALPSAFEAGSDWTYCNTNYVLLGMVIEKVTGAPWGAFLSERIFKPLQMTSARTTDLRATIPNRALGYVMVKGALQPEKQTAQIWNSTADGSLYLNVEDLAKWNDALLTGKLLKRATIEQMWTVFLLKDGKPNPGGYGFGFFIHSVNGHRLIDHEGIWQGFHDYSAIYPDDHIAITVLTNLAYPLSRPQDIGKVVASLYQPALRPSAILPIPDNHPVRTMRLHHLLDAVIAGKASQADFTPEMWKRIGNNVQVRDWLKAQGPILTFELVDEGSDNGHAELRYRARTTERIFTFTFVLNKDGKIVNLALSS
jgi:CubicO group peptidase (beta-lactamase class C family)